MKTRTHAIHDAMVGALIDRLHAGVKIQEMVGEEFYDLDIRTGEEATAQDWQRIPSVIVEQSHVDAALRGLGAKNEWEFRKATAYVAV